jgi:hypothetical protein
LEKCKDDWPTLTNKARVTDCFKKLFWSIHHVHDPQKGIPVLKLPPLDPWKINTISISSSDAFSGELTDVLFWGFLDVLNERNMDIM